jgi:hypothetical protein
LLFLALIYKNEKEFFLIKNKLNTQQETYIQKACGFGWHMLWQSLLQIKYLFFPQKHRSCFFEDDFGSIFTSAGN